MTCAAGDQHDVAGAGLAGAPAEQHGALAAAAAAVRGRGGGAAAHLQHAGRPHQRRAAAHAAVLRATQRERYLLFLKTLLSYYRLILPQVKPNRLGTKGGIDIERKQKEERKLFPTIILCIHIK